MSLRTEQSLGNQAALDSTLRVLGRASGKYIHLLGLSNPFYYSDKARATLNY